MEHLPLILFVLTAFLGKYTLATSNDPYCLLGAADSGNLEQVNHWIQKGVNIDLADDENQTALMYAADRGYVEVVKCLIEKGANKNAVNIRQQTSLMLAAANGCSNVVKYLTESGAELDALDSSGNSSNLCCRYAQLGDCQVFD